MLNSTFRFHAEHVVTTRRSGRITAGLFGWIHAGGAGELTDVGPGRLTGGKYVELLEDVLLPSVRAMLVPGPEQFYLVQDNSPIHTCRTVKAWFREHPEIILLPHPPASPDLNPIEDVWAAMNKNFPHNCDRSRAAVVQNALQAWEDLRSPVGQRNILHSVTSMPRRLNSVLAAGGGYIKY